jgi:hypothetical protein
MEQLQRSMLVPEFSLALGHRNRASGISFPVRGRPLMLMAALCVAALISCSSFMSEQN